ncbi:MAG: hypothetical protein OHK0046_42370 [Anaerolineae bacterium]
MSVSTILQPSTPEQQPFLYVIRYLSVIGLVTGAFLARMLLAPWVGGENPFLLFFSVIMISAWIGGLRAGLLATASAALFSMFDYANEESFTATHQAGLTLFLLEGLLISVLTYRLRLTRKQTIEALKASQERFEIALRTAKISVYGNDRDLNYTWICNPHPSFPPERMIGKRDDELLPLENVAELVALKQQVLTSGQGRQKRISTHINGEPLSFFVTVEPDFNHSEKPVGVTVATLDITEAERTRNALQAQEHFMQTVLQALPSMVYIFDVQKRTNRFVSDHAVQALGYTPQEIMAAGSDFIGQRMNLDDLERLEEHFQALRDAAPGATVSFDYQMQHKDGTWRTFSTQDMVFRRDANGEPLEILGVAQDVTGRKATADTLAGQAEQLRLAKEAAELGVYDFDLVRGSLKWDERSRELWGVPAGAEVTRETFYNGLHPDDLALVRAAVEKVYDPEGEGKLAIEYRVINQMTGAVHWVAATGQVMFEDGRPVRLIGTAQDITHRHVLREQLERRNEQLRLAKEAAGLGIHDYNVVSGHIAWDTRTRAIWGVEADETITLETFYNGIHPHYRAGVEDALNRALDPEGEGTYYAEYRVIHRVDGRMRWIAATGQATFDAGQAVRLTGTVQDITPQKHMQAQLELALERYQTMADAMPQLVWTADSDGIVDYYNNRVNHYDGLEADADGKWHWQPVVHPDDTNMTVNAWNKATRLREVYTCEHRLSMTDGSYRWHISRAIPAIDKNGQVRWYGTATDVHEIKMATQHLREREQRLAISTRAAGLGVFEWNANEDDTLWENERMYQIFGHSYTDGTVTRSDFFAHYIHPEDIPAFEQSLARAQETGMPFHAQCRIRRRSDQALRWLEFHGQFETNSEGEFIRHIGVIADITERKQVEARSHILQTLAAALARARTVEELTEVIIKQGVQSLGARGGTIALLSEDRQALHIVKSVGYPQSVVDKWWRLPIDHPTAPLALAVREGQNLWMRNPAEREEIVPLTARLTKAEQHQAWAVLPIRSSRGILGVIGLGFDTQQEFSDLERAFLITLCDYCGYALERAQLTEEIQRLTGVEERARLARELHDAVKQLLFASMSIAQTLPRLWEHNPARARDYTTDVVNLNRAALAEIQTLLLEMRPEAIVTTPFKILINNLCNALRGHKMINIQVEYMGPDDLHLPADTQVAVYRIAQEAFNNINKHSEATQVEVECYYDDTFSLRITDNGKGFDLKRATMGFGLNTMQERARAAGVLYNIRSAANEGTEVVVEWEPAV